MKKRLVSLLLAAAMLVLLAVPAFAEDGHAYTYVALGDSITTGVGLKDTHFSSTAKSYDVQENYHDYSKDCYVARVADALGLDRDHAVNYGMPAAMSSNILDLVRTGSTASGVAYYDLPTLRQELADADLITLLIGSNDTVLQLMGAMGKATNGKATKLLIPLLTGTMRELNLQTLQTLRKGLENLDLTPEELKAALKLLDSGMEEICDQTRDQTVANVEQILQELRALNPDAQIILVGYYNPLPFLPTYGRHFRLLNRSGYLAIVATNQPAVARGMCGMTDVEEIHRKLATLLGQEGAYLDGIVFCPHHPDKGYPEENPAYKIPCRCRKPDTGMLTACAAAYNIDLSQSWMVGDTTVDIQTGLNAGTHTALVLTGEAGKDGKYDVQPQRIGADLLDVVKQIIGG